MNRFLAGLPAAARRDALRALRGQVLRTELYALDGSPRQDRPYTVTEHAYALREEDPPAPARTGAGSSSPTRWPAAAPSGSAAPSR